MRERVADIDAILDKMEADQAPRELFISPLGGGDGEAVAVPTAAWAELRAVGGPRVPALRGDLDHGEALRLVAAVRAAGGLSKAAVKARGLLAAIVAKGRGLAVTQARPAAHDEGEDGGASARAGKTLVFTSARDPDADPVVCDERYWAAVLRLARRAGSDFNLEWHVTEVTARQLAAVLTRAAPSATGLLAEPKNTSKLFLMIDLLRQGPVIIERRCN